MRVSSASLLRIVTAAMAASCGGRVASVEEAIPDPSPSPTTSPTSTTTPPTLPKPPPPPPPTECTAPKELLQTPAYGCADTWYLPCGVPADIDVTSGNISSADCQRLCGPFPAPNGTYWGCAPTREPSAPSPSFDCFTCVAGRRPAGFVDQAHDATVAGWLVTAALLEHASIEAFEILARELTHHRAPARLVHEARRAARDEIRHTRAMAALARREGRELRPASSPPRGEPRSLLDLALENVVEGCVREAYGAVVATWQAENAARLDVRRAASAIAPDEATHADLAWRVHAWALPQLSSAERARVEHALRAAFRELRVSAAQPVPPELVRELGLPSADDALRLVDGLEAELALSLVA